MSETKRSARLRLILTYYILWKLRKQPQIIQRIVRPYFSGGVSKHGNEAHIKNYVTDADIADTYVDESGDTMSGNLDMAGHKIYTTNFCIKELDSDYLQIMNRAETQRKRLAIRYLSVDLDAVIKGQGNFRVWISIK